MTTPIFGKAIPRTEDLRFLTGQSFANLPEAWQRWWMEEGRR